MTQHNSRTARLLSQKLHFKQSCFALCDVIWTHKVQNTVNSSTSHAKLLQTFWQTDRNSFDCQDWKNICRLLNKQKVWEAESVRVQAVEPSRRRHLSINTYTADIKPSISCRVLLRNNSWITVIMSQGKREQILLSKHQLMERMFVGQSLGSCLHRSWVLLTSWSSMLLEQRMSVAQPFGWSCREVMQFPLSLSPGISGVKTSKLFLGERPARTNPVRTVQCTTPVLSPYSLTFSVRVHLSGVISLARGSSQPGCWCASICRITSGQRLISLNWKQMWLSYLIFSQQDLNNDRGHLIHGRNFV